MIELNGEPFLAHQLRLLSSRGIERVVLCVGYRGEMIRDFVGDGSRGLGCTQKSCSTDRCCSVLLAPFATRFRCWARISLSCTATPICLAIILPWVRAFLRSGKRGLMTVFRNDGKFDASNVEYRDGQIVRYDKKSTTPAMRHIDYGLGAFRADVFAELPDGVPCDLAAVYQSLLSAGTWPLSMFRNASTRSARYAAWRRLPSICGGPRAKL